MKYLVSKFNILQQNLYELNYDDGANIKYNATLQLFLH